MSKKPKVSVLIPSYNHAHYIAEAIESILEQTLKDFQLVIVDDGSTDNSWEIIQRYVQSDRRIIAIKQENRGPSAAVNRALEVAHGDFIATHTSDDRSAPTRLEKQADFLDSHADYDAVGSFIEEIDNNGQLKAWGAYEAWFNVAIDTGNPGSWVWNNRVASPTLMLRGSFFESYGNYDQDLVYTQDWEILIRAISRGCKLAILPERLFQYRSHGSNLTHRNATRTFWEYAYISSKALHPWLIGAGHEDLIAKNIEGFLHHQAFAQLHQNEHAALAGALLHEFAGTFREFIQSYENEQKDNRIEALLLYAYRQVQVQLNQLWAEHTRIMEERDKAIVETGNVITESDNSIIERDKMLAARDAVIGE